VSDRERQLEIEGVAISFGGLEVLRDVSMDVRKGEIAAMVGPNGAGKTCLLNCIVGLYRPDRGSITLKGEDLGPVPVHRRPLLGLGRTFQGAELFEHMTVAENLLLGRHAFLRSSVLEDMIWFGRARREAIANREKVEEVIDFFELERYRDTPVGVLPYGVQKLVGVARALATEPDLLLLDEPAAGMNRQEKEDLARFMLRTTNELGISLFWVEHDMELVGDLADRIFVLDQGTVISSGDWATVSSDPRVIEAYLGAGAAAGA